MGRCGQALAVIRSRCRVGACPTLPSLDNYSNSPGTVARTKVGPGLVSLYSRRAVIQSTVVNASASSVFCSTSWALAEPVAGLALPERFTECTGRSSVMCFKRGNM